MDADAAGVLFTANPTTGSLEEIVVSAARGLGEAVVGGTVTPDGVVIEKATELPWSRSIHDQQLAVVSEPEKVLGTLPSGAWDKPPKEVAFVPIAPTGETGGWSFDFIKTPAINGIYVDGKHPSALVTGHLRGGKAGAARPTCDTVLNQPCRRNLTPVPSRTMTIR